MALRRAGWLRWISEAGKGVLDRINNQETINDAAIRGSQCALDQVSDPDVIMRAAVMGSDTALSKLHGDERPSFVYTKAKDSGVKDKAFRRIQSEELKVELSPQYAHSYEYLLRKHANDPEALLDIIQGMPEHASRSEALQNVTDPDVLVMFAVQTSKLDFRDQVIWHIDDPNALYQVFVQLDRSWHVQTRKEIIDGLNEPSVLEKIVRGDYDLSIRKYAANRYLSVSNTTQAEKDALIEYMLEQVSLIDMFDVLPASMQAKHGFTRSDKIQYNGEDTFNIPEEWTEYNYQGKLLNPRRK